MSRATSYWVGFAAWALAFALAGTAGASAQVPLSEITDTRPTITADDRVLGNADAPITMFEYASLTCPHCAAFNADTLPRIKAAWIAAGKAKLVFRDYPLDNLALKAAAVARCVPPDRFFDVVDALFKDQGNWARIKDADKSLARIAEVAGFSKSEADACANDVKLLDSIAAERLRASTKYGITATPTFVINGRTVVGDKSYADFEKVLHAATQP